MEDLNLLSDETLVSLFAKGENSAFDELLQRHQNRIFSYILNIVKEKELRLNYDDAIRDMEQKCKEMQEQLHQLLYQRESALHILRSDRSTYQEEVKTRLLMLDIWLRDQRKLFNERQAQKKEVEP